MERLENLSEAEQHAILTILVRRLSETLTDMGYEVPQFALLIFNDLRMRRCIANCSNAAVNHALREMAVCLGTNKTECADTPPSPCISQPLLHDRPTMDGI